MSLAAVLSAMRTIILDGIEFPDNAEERKRVFRNTFTGLSETELEDLAIIPPEKFKIYSQTIFSGERNVLSNHFPITFSLLRNRLENKFNANKMIRDLHSIRPWKSYLTAGLVDNFVTYLAEDCPEIVDEIPEIIDVARMEKATLELGRGLDEKDSGGDFCKVAQLTVAELLEVKVKLSQNIRLLNLNFDVLELRNYFYENDRELPHNGLSISPIKLVGGRSPDLRVRWIKVEDGFFEFLSSIGDSHISTVAEFAEAYISDLAPGMPEDLLFAQFLALLRNLHEAGILGLVSIN